MGDDNPLDELLDDDDPTGLSREGRRQAERAGRTHVERFGGSLMVRFPSGRGVSLDLSDDAALREQILSKLSPEERAEYERIARGPQGAGEGETT